MKMKKCKLCGEDKKLVNSHIIPEGFYKVIYDENNRVFFSSESRKKFDFLQKGQREYMLCENCDRDLLGPYDKYGIEVIRDNKYVNKEKYNGGELWTNIDYKKFKLFLLSVLLRAHLAEKHFTGIDLDDAVVSKLKNVIINENVPVEKEFPIIGAKLVDPLFPLDKNDQIITNGNIYERYNCNNSNICTFVFGGYGWSIIIPRGEFKDPQEKAFLQDNGDLFVVYVNIREYYPITHIQSSIDFSSRKFSEFKSRHH